MAEYIEREAAKRELLEWAVIIQQPRHLLSGDAMCVLDNIPAADVAPVVHGQWERRGSSWHCTRCGRGYRIICGAVAANGHKYCPNCGAKMDGGDNDDKSRDT